jgi:hypothetical protein
VYLICSEKFLFNYNSLTQDMGMTVVWDNTAFHKRQDFQQAVELLDARLVFLSDLLGPDLRTRFNSCGWSLKPGLGGYSVPGFLLTDLLDGFLLKV